MAQGSAEVNGVELESKLDKNLLKNKVFDVRREIETNPCLLLNNPELLERARTSLMVETLLQLHNLRPGFGKGGRKVNFKDRTDGGNDEIFRAIRASFPILLARWPETALQVLDCHLHYKGYCSEDPELRVDIDLSLLSGWDHFEGQFRKPVQLLHLAELNPSSDLKRRIILHPVVLTYLHLKAPSEIFRHMLNFILLITGILFCVTSNFASYIEKTCVQIGYSYQSEPESFNQEFNILLIFSVTLFINFSLEVIKLIIFRKSYIWEFLLFLSPQIGVVVIFFFWRRVIIVSLIVVLVGNFLDSLSCANFFGKFILLAKAVLKTMSKIIAPVILLLMSLAASDFVLRYSDTVIEEQISQWTTADEGGEHETELENFCRTISPLDGRLGDEVRSLYVKSIFQVLNIMYGQIDTSDLTVGHKVLQSVESKIDPAYAIHWLLCTVVTCIILMNLLIGLTIGDVDEIAIKADCQVVQIKLRKVYFRQVISTLFSSLFKRIGLCKKKTSKHSTIVTIYPNKFRESCAVEKRSSFWTQLKNLWTKNYILGCSPVRKKILHNFKE